MLTFEMKLQDEFNFGKEQGEYTATLANIKNAMAGFSLSFDEVCDKLKISDREQYREHV